jgi:DNA-binding NtrC family response regulator
MQLITEDGASLHSFLGMTAVIRSLPMRQVLSTVQKIAKSNAAVLVTGETGSGKEVIARACSSTKSASSTSKCR